MSIMKNEILILEFDTDTTAVIMPTHEHFPLELPRKAVYAFLGEHVDNYAKNHDYKQVATFVSETKLYPIYVGNYKGEDICLCQAPVGAAAAAQIMDWLIGYGVKEIISGGCCGALKDFAENVFIVPSRALRDEGASYHYMAPSRYVEIEEAALKAIKKTLTEHNLQYTEVMTWSTDGFYRETKEKVAYRKEEGCAVVEMECSALAACAKMRGAIFGEILFTADSLANVEEYDERGWGGDSFAYALKLCLDAVVKL